MKTVDAVSHAFHAKVDHEGCLDPQLKVSDTWPLGEPSISEYSSAFLSWTELWTVNACGSSMDLKVVYMLHNKTGLIELKLSWLKEGQPLALS